MTLGMKSILILVFPSDKNWKTGWWIPRYLGKIEVRATARNKWGNISQDTKTIITLPRYEITGYVTKNGNSITNAKITIINNNDNIENHRISDNQGWFMISFEEEGEYTLQASFENEISEKIQISLTPEDYDKLVTLKIKENKVDE